MSADPRDQQAAATPGPDSVQHDTTPPYAPPHAAPAPLPPHTIRRTRISGVWIAMGCFAVVLVLLLIFILQNSKTVDISYLGTHGHLPLGVALLLSAALGVLLVILPGTARIIQLHVTARRHRYADVQCQPGRTMSGGAGPAT
jgi:lipopolysaccharide assembly protein A